MTYAGAPVTIKVLDPLNDDGEVLDNTNAIARVTIFSPAGVVLVNAALMPWDATYLRWEYQWDTSGLSAGHYSARVDLTPTAGLATPKYVDIDLQAPPGTTVALAASPLDPWPADLCCDTAGVDQVLVDRMVMAATEVYWALSGRQFGVYSIPPVRPCRRQCYDGSGVQWTGGSPFTLGASGWQVSGPLWLDAMCGSCTDDCSCESIEEVLLPSPVAEIAQVKVDGVVLDPSAYRVDDWRLLVRTDGGAWPSCQSMGLPDTAVGTWSVLPKIGKRVPVLGELAVGELACELIRGCREPSECAVPAHVVARTRAGISESFIDLADLIKYKLTGFPAGDYFLRTFNPSGLSSRSSVHSPDYKPARRAGT